MWLWRWLCNALQPRPSFNPRWRVDLSKSVNQLDGCSREYVIDHIVPGDYIMWSETSGQPGDEWYCGRTCDGIVRNITDDEYVVIGVGYYGIGDTILSCPRQSTMDAPGQRYKLRTRGISCVVKHDDIVWWEAQYDRDYAQSTRSN